MKRATRDSCYTLGLTGQFRVNQEKPSEPMAAKRYTKVSLSFVSLIGVPCIKLSGSRKQHGPDRPFITKLLLPVVCNF